MARDDAVQSMEVERAGENRAPEADAAQHDGDAAKVATKQPTPASPTATAPAPVDATTKDAPPASPSDAPTPVVADTPASPTAFPAAAAATPSTPAAASTSAASSTPATPITPASSAEAAAAKLARKQARKKKRLALEAAKKLSALGPAGSNAAAAKSFIDDRAHQGSEDDEKDDGDDLDDSDDDEEDTIDPKAEAEGLAELEQNFISKEGEDSYGDKRSALMLNRQLDEENEQREMEKIKKRMGIREENKQLAASAAGALAAALSAAAAGNGSSGSASAAPRPRNLGDRIFHAAAAAEQIALGKARAIKGESRAEGEQDGQDEDARAVAELQRRKAEQAELRRLKLARGRILKPQHLGPATGTTTNPVFAAANNQPTLSASAPLSSTATAAASSDPTVDAADVTMLADSSSSRPGTPTMHNSAPTLSRQDSFSGSHSLLSCSMLSRTTSTAIAMSDSQIALLGGIKKTNVALTVVGISRTKTGMPPSSASAAVMAATIPVVRTASIFAPVASAATSGGSSKLSNFDTFNQEITRKANVGLIRTGSFLQRAQSSGGALLRRGLTEAMNGPPSAAAAAGSAATPVDGAKDFSHMFSGSSANKPVVRALGGSAGSSMGGMAAAKMSKKVAQGTKQAFVFKAAGAGSASRDGFEHERSSPSAAAAAASSASVPSPSALSRSATGSGSSSGAASPSASAMSFTSFMSSTPAALSGMKRQSSSHSLSGYEDESSQSAKPSALFHKLKKNKL